MPEGEQLAMIVFRWIHFLAGITWIGLLYYLNLVNVRFVPNIDAALRPQIVPLNLARVLAWFRHAAWLTVLMGLLMAYMKYWRDGDLFNTNADKTIFMGGLLGIIMAINVWAIIWPNQKKILGAMRSGTGPDPSWGRNALYASRVNFTLSFPMLWFMGAATNYPMDWSGILVAFVVTSALALFVWNTVQRWMPSRF